MSRDIVRDNIDCYVGAQARQDWTADAGLYPFEETVIARHFPRPPARVLDLGCGAGRTTIGLETRGYQVEAIDLSADLVEEARKRLNRTRVQVMDARELAFADASFDAVLFSFNGLDCVYPQRERVRVLESIHRVLRPGGVFYYSGHNGLAQWGPRPGDTIGKLFRRDRDLLLAQRHSFGERRRYLAYPGATGTQVLYSALPYTHVSELARIGLRAIGIYGSRRFQHGPHLDTASIVRIALTCPHVHYVAVRGDA